MSDEGSVSRWLDEVKSGDQEAARKLWLRYFQRLVRLGDQRLHGAARRVKDGEDVALSALESFFEGAREGKYPKLTDREALWKLLGVIAARKVCDYIQHEGREKRGADKVRGESALDSHASTRRGLEGIADEEPPPDVVIRAAEECERMLDALNEESLRQVAELKLAGWTNKEIAQQMDVSLRSVERKLEVIRAKWSHEASEDERNESV